MRNITEQASASFKRGANFSLSNTLVKNDEVFTTMYLHGNMIARIKNNCGQLFIRTRREVTDGKLTNVTKERLNGILSLYGLGHIRVRKGKIERVRKDGGIDETLEKLGYQEFDIHFSV